MNKCKFLTMAAIAATMVMTSCSKGDETVNNNDRVAAQFSAGNMAYVQTRVNGTDWGGGEHIGIYMLNNNGSNNFSLTATNISVGVDNREYEASTGPTATFTSPDGNTIYYPASGDDVKFIAYYPYSSSVNGAYELPVSVADQTDQSAIDVLYAPAGTASNKILPDAVLPFEHKLVKLAFSIITSGDVTIKIDNQYTTGTLNLVNGTVAPTGNETNDITVQGQGGNSVIEAIVFPGTNTGKKFHFTDNSGTYTVDIPDNWVGGTLYYYSVTLVKTTAVITGTIAPWGTVSNTGGSVTAN
ncbi:hypothetical protein AGMMS49574_19910 [Bacteroidia bacterium]|nr:hypothetical protein AGMMS49574_19910 [Bacteroidia bacterium]